MPNALEEVTGGVPKAPTPPAIEDILGPPPHAPAAPHVGRHGGLGRLARPSRSIGQRIHAEKRQAAQQVIVKYAGPVPEPIKRAGEENPEGYHAPKGGLGRPGYAARKAALGAAAQGVADKFRRKPQEPQAKTPETDAGTGFTPEQRAARAKQYGGIDDTMAALRKHQEGRP